MFEAHYGSVSRALRRLGIPDAQVDDAAQRVFVVAARRLDVIERGGEGRYLHGIALRVASEIRRRDPSRREVHDEQVLAALPDEAPGPEEALLRHEMEAALAAAIDRLPADLRAVFVLVELEGRPIVEAASILGVPLGTATSRLRRAREAFDRAAQRMRARHRAVVPLVLAKIGGAVAGLAAAAVVVLALRAPPAVVAPPPPIAAAIDPAPTTPPAPPGVAVSALPDAPLPPPLVRPAPGRDDLAAETRALREAKAALASGDAARAEALLATYRMRFSRGILRDEAAILAIDAALAEGDRTRARSIASAIVAGDPRGPWAPRARRALIETEEP